MAVDYNLVVLGSSSTARYAAIQARQYSARVALILPPPGSFEKAGNAIAPHSCEWSTILAYLRHLNYSRFVCQYGPYNMGGALFQKPTTAQNAFGLWSVNWNSIMRSLSLFASKQNDEDCASSLAHLGIDVIQGNGQFVTDPQLGLKVNNSATGIDHYRYRLLRSQSYLIAMEGQAIVPAIAGIESVRPHTLDTFFQPNTFTNQPQSVLIISDKTEGIEVATGLAHLGTRVTLIMATPQLLPSADLEVNQWLRTSLKASGIKVYLGATIKQIDSKDNRCVATIELGNDPINLEQGDRPTQNASTIPTITTVAADELLLVMGRQVDFTTLNLRSIAVDYTPQGITVDAHYQSSHTRVFAIGDAIDHTSTLAQGNHYQAEAAIALHQALFRGPLLNSLKAGLSLPSPPTPEQLPTILNTHPPAAWMGWTESESYQRYGDRISILYQSFQHLPQAQLLSAYIPQATAGFCKLIVLDNGQIVGVHIVGIQAEELVNLITIAMHQSLPMETLSQLYPPVPSLTADVLRGLVQQWQRDRLHRRSRFADWLELALNWQRDWMT